MSRTTVVVITRTVPTLLEGGQDRSAARQYVS